MKYSIPRLAECVQREIKMRRHVYPWKIGTKEMSQKQADEEIDMMLEIQKLILSQEKTLL